MLTPDSRFFFGKTAIRKIRIPIWIIMVQDHFAQGAATSQIAQMSSLTELDPTKVKEPIGYCDTIVLCPTLCDQLKHGQLDGISIKFGCKPAPI